MKIPFLLISIFLFVLSLSGQSSAFETAQISSAETNKPILMIFSGSDWCKPCILLKKEVLLSSVFETYAQDHLVLLEVDFPYRKANKLSKEKQQANDALADKYNPEGNFPKAMLLNADGKVIGIVNAREKNSFLREIEKLLKINS